MSNPAISSRVYQELPAYEEDEINLSEVFSKIWHRRKFIVYFVSIVMLLVLGIGAFLYLLNPAVKDYSISMRFNFPTSAQGKYPAGQQFSNNDLIASVILKQVYNSNDVQSQGISFEKFAAAFSIVPFAENAKFIQKKYEQLLSNKKLTRTDIESLEKQYKNEISTARAGFAKIKYVDDAHLGLSPVLIEKVLNDVPKVWSEMSIRDLGVLDLKIPGKNFYQPELVEQYEYLQAAQYMLDSTKQFQKMLGVLNKDNMGGFVRDPETGMVVSDLLSHLNSIERFDLEPVYSVIANLGLVKNKQQARLYLLNQIEMIQDQMVELNQKIKVYKDAMLAYAAHGKEQIKDASASAVSSNGMVQYGDGFLSSIVGMVKKNKETQYRQSLLDKQISFSIKKQELATKQEKLKRALLVLDDGSTKTSKLIAFYENKIKQINQEILQLVAAYQHILESRNAHVLGANSALYSIESAQMMVSSDFKSKFKKLIMLTVAFSIVALMISVFIALLVKEKPVQKKL